MISPLPLDGGGGNANALPGGGDPGISCRLKKRRSRSDEVNWGKRAPSFDKLKMRPETNAVPHALRPSRGEP